MARHRAAQSRHPTQPTECRMKTHRPLATALLAVLVGLAALPQTSFAGTEARKVGDFSSISLRNEVTVKVAQGSSTAPWGGQQQSPQRA